MAVFASNNDTEIGNIMKKNKAELGDKIKGSNNFCYNIHEIKVTERLLEKCREKCTGSLQYD